MCRACKNAPSTGEIFELCDPCFDKLEQRIKDSPTGRIKLTDEEFEWVADDHAVRKN